MTTYEPVWSRREARPLGWWGMLLLVATEGTLFTVLLASYFYIRFENVVWPPEGIAKPKVLLPCVLTGALVSTSIPIAIAGRAAASGRQRLLRAALITTFALGLAYALLQYRQFQHDWGDFKPDGHAYGSLYYTITGLHWAHVIAGLLLLAFVGIQAWRPVYRPVRPTSVQVTTLYWHFVNVLAVAILVSLYLLPQL